MISAKGSSSVARGGQEIAPQTISTKDVYQSKHMVVLPGEQRRQILIQLTTMINSGSSLLTHTKNH